MTDGDLGTGAEGLKDAFQCLFALVSAAAGLRSVPALGTDATNVDLMSLQPPYPLQELTDSDVMSRALGPCGGSRPCRRCSRSAVFICRLTLVSAARNLTNSDWYCPIAAA